MSVVSITVPAGEIGHSAQLEDTTISQLAQETLRTKPAHIRAQYASHSGVGILPHSGQLRTTTPPNRVTAPTRPVN